jgi:hypothetical protein
MGFAGCGRIFFLQIICGRADADKSRKIPQKIRPALFRLGLGEQVPLQACRWWMCWPEWEGVFQSFSEGVFQSSVASRQHLNFAGPRAGLRDFCNFFKLILKMQKMQEKKQKMQKINA